MDTEFSPAAALAVESSLRSLILPSVAAHGFDASRVRIDAGECGGGLWNTIIKVDGERLADVGYDVSYDDADDEQGLSPLHTERLGADWYVYRGPEHPAGDRTQYDDSEDNLTPAKICAAVLDLLTEGGFTGQ